MMIVKLNKKGARGLSEYCVDNEDLLFRVLDVLTQFDNDLDTKELCLIDIILKLSKILDDTIQKRIIKTKVR